jgi:hypothetical protein
MVRSRIEVDMWMAPSPKFFPDPRASRIFPYRGQSRPEPPPPPRQPLGPLCRPALSNGGSGSPARKRLEAGETQRSVAPSKNVSQSTISRL